MSEDRAGGGARHEAGAGIPPAYLERLRRTLPERAASRLELVSEGDVNDVVIVDDELVCRFPKRRVPGEGLVREARALALVSRHVSVAVPRYLVAEERLAVYRLLVGEPLGRERLNALVPFERAALVGQMVSFLEDLHAVPPSEVASAGVGRSPATRDRAGWLDVLDRVRDELGPHLLGGQRAWVESWFAPVASGELAFDAERRLVHGDLAPSHLLVRPSPWRLSGVLDFGAAGLGDPAVDLAGLLHGYGEMVVAALEGSPALAAHLPRARFWAGTVVLQRALAALERGDRQGARAVLASVPSLGAG